MSDDPSRPPDPRAAIVAEWLSKADADFDPAQREAGVTNRRHNDAIGFLSQQSVEKLMKAVLIARRIHPPLTHDLETWNDLLQQSGGPAAADAADLVRLSEAAVRTRYPGRSFSEHEASELLGVARRVRAKLRPLV